MFVNCTDIHDNDGFDALAILFPNVNVDFMHLNSIVLSHLELDNRLGTESVLITNDDVTGSRLVMVPLGSLNGDIDDVRRYSEGAKSLLKFCSSIGINKPLIWFIDPNDCLRLESDYKYRKIVGMLALESELYMPLQAREHFGVMMERELGIFNLSDPVASWVYAVNAGKCLAKDIGGSDPERMAPLKCASYILDAFRSDENVNVTIMTDRKQLQQEYPLLDAVARASYEVSRHSPCVVRKYFRT